MPTASYFPKEDCLIVPVKTLQAGDRIRDFYTKDPSYGVVREVNPTADGGRGLARVLWDGDSVTTALRFKSAHGKRGDIIRCRREGEA